MVCRRSTGHIQSFRFGAPDGVQASRAGDDGEVQSASAVAEQVEVPPDAQRFSFFGLARQPESGARRSLVHEPFGVQGGVLCLGEDSGAEGLVVFEGPAQHFRPLNRGVIAERQGTRFDQRTGFGQFDSFPALADGRHGQGRSDLVRAGGCEHAHLGGLVATGAGGGHRGDTTEPTGRSHIQAPHQPLGPVGARVAEVALQVPPTREGHIGPEVPIPRFRVQRSRCGFHRDGLSGFMVNVDRLTVEVVSGLDPLGDAVTGHGGKVGFRLWSGCLRSGWPTSV